MAKNTKVNETVNPGVKGAFEAFLTDNKLSISDIRKMLSENGKRTIAQQNAARAVSAVTGLKNLDGLNLSALEMLYAFSRETLPEDADICSVTRPKVYEKAIKDAMEQGKKADPGAAVRSASQCWRCLIDAGWHITLTKGDYTYKK